MLNLFLLIILIALCNINETLPFFFFISFYFFGLFNMVLEVGFMRRDLISNTTYSYWSYMMINFFKGKRMRDMLVELL